MTQDRYDDGLVEKASIAKLLEMKHNHDIQIESNMMLDHLKKKLAVNVEAKEMSNLIGKKLGMDVKKDKMKI